MARTIGDEFQKYFANLTATSDICDTLGTTLVFGTNLFVGYEPASATRCITITPYDGDPPNIDKERQTSYVQIRVKTPSNRTSFETSQSIINALHCNKNVCASQPGKVFAIQSTAMPLEYQQGGELLVTISNFQVKYIKL